MKAPVPIVGLALLVAGASASACNALLGINVIPDDAGTSRAPSPDAADSPAAADAGDSASAGDAGPAEDAGDSSADVVDAGADAADAAGCYPVPSGAVSWWRGEGTAVDAYGQNDGKLTNTTYVAGMVGQAFAFSGGYLASSTLGFPLGTSDRTVEMWARIAIPYAGSGGSYSIGLFLGYGGWGTPGGAYELVVLGGSNSNYPTDSLAFSQWGSQFVSNRSLSENQWHHLAVTLAGGKTSIYLDGALCGAQDASASLPINTVGGTMYMGGLPPSVYGKSPQAYLTGDVDEATVYARALGADEIEGIFAAGTLGKCP